MGIENLLEDILEFSQKPPLFEPGAVRFWDDPHISKSMLAAHLDPEHDGASRPPETIAATVAHFLASGLLKPGYRVLDLGCGPGLYAEAFSRAGMNVVGIDISERSLAYARARAEAGGQDIDYRCMNFLDIGYREAFDAVLQVYGELCVFPDDKRDLLLGRVHQALKKDGLFCFDVSTRALRAKVGLKNRWIVSAGGFWRPGTHLVLEAGFDYPEAGVWLDQYGVIDGQGCTVYRNWFHDYSVASITRVLDRTGFKIVGLWNDLTGSSFSEDGDWIAVAAVKRE